jgi:membrane protein
MRRARDFARHSMLPPAHEPLPVRLVAIGLRGVRRLVRRVLDDRIEPRAAALAFHSILSLVPAAAIAVALLELFGGAGSAKGALEHALAHYFPDEALSGVHALAPLVESVDFSTLGLLGVATLFPVAIVILSQVELALSDIFRTRRPKKWLRLPLYALLVTAAPLVAMMSSLLRTDRETDGALERGVVPFLVTWGLLYVVFRLMPGGAIKNRAAVAGALFAALAIGAAKAIFDVWAQDLARGTRAAWGAVAFVPIVLVWVFVAWYLVLLGAEVAAVVHELTTSLTAPAPVERTTVPRWRRRRRLRLRAAKRATMASLRDDG